MNKPIASSTAEPASTPAPIPASTPRATYWLVREVGSTPPMVSFEFSADDAEATKQRWLGDGYEGEFVELIERATTLASTAELRAAAQAMVDRCDMIHADPRYMSIWTDLMIHGRPYSGPNYAEELKALRTALATAPQAGQAEP
jgi:hypothetical protein